MDSVYDNRELSWLKFNERVLYEASDTSVPVIERLRFLSISTSNLDEFFMVRVGSLYDKIIEKRNKSNDDKTNLTNEQQLKTIFEKTQEFYQKKKEISDSVFDELSKNNIKLKSVDSLFDGKQSQIEKNFEHFVKPLLTVFVIDEKEHFPHLENKQVYCAFHLTKKGRNYLGIVSKSLSLEDVIWIKDNKSFEFVITDDVILKYSEKLFSGFKVLEKCKVRVTRNADMDLSKNLTESDEEYRSRMKLFLKKRVRLSPVRIEISKNISKDFKKLILNKNMSNLLIVNRNHLSFDFANEIQKRIPTEIKEKLMYTPCTQKKGIKNVIKTVNQRDLFLSYPFDSMDTFINLLEEASTNEDVISIKITLYRLSQNSRVIASLIKAAKNNKDVTAVIELRARFDEQNNINYSEILENAGVKVVFGPKNIKIHSKLCLIIKKGKDKYITQCGTGNYNEKTADEYTDMNIITTDPAIGRDAENFFYNIINGSLDFTTEKLISSPDKIEEKLMELIDYEIMYHKLYNNGKIILKINSLTQKNIIDKLTEASENGVEVKLIVRGVCCLIPKNENITVISIVGRYLEHSRVYFFNHNGLMKTYISSADIMTRNLKYRVEIMCPVEKREIKEKIFNSLELILRDDVKARIMDKNGIYTKKDNKNNINSQILLFENTDKKDKKESKFTKEKNTSYFKWLINGGNL